ncbi:MAG: 4-hydroxy-3-methylbut-2-enyl diphosphate reductase [Candidatus Omnitrophota bacterium]|nr:MAG: 4-hydroxy-3-methylbut-2-enyl diphosphate reductase [Candidatus Omnitrophota bacterium]
MKITLAKTAGFCFGVKRALDKLLEAAQSNSKVVILGDIVHNEDVVRSLKKVGIKKTTKLTKGDGTTLLIRAHGTPLRTYQKAQKLNYNIVDATCPMVKEIHKIAKDAENKGYKIIVIGDKNHDEVRGIMGQLETKSLVINTSYFPLKEIKKIKKAAIVVQSTQNTEKVLKLSEKLKKYIKDLKFFNTICNPTRRKQEEIRKMPLENDLMLIVGSKTSANTKRLYEISKSLNKQSHWIQSKKNINPVWFRRAKSVGITAGASTPESTIREVINHIKKITS